MQAVVEFNEDTQGYRVCIKGGGPVLAEVSALDGSLAEQLAIASAIASSLTFTEGHRPEALDGLTLTEVADLFASVFSAYRTMNKAPVAPGSLSARAQALLTKLKPESGDG